MPTPIILSSVIASWPIMCAIFGGAAVAVVLLTMLVAVVTRPRHQRPRAWHAVPPAGTAPSASRATSDQHALV
ncbi:MAG TPA: hypothetical protein VMB74_07140 [Streptosporangiaceae bacterium]|nr:hypothetical protein [Streptosporangiaceae bacterium]